MNIASRLGGLGASAVVAGAATGLQTGASIGKAAWEETGIGAKLSAGGEAVENFFTNAATSVGKKMGLEDYQPGGAKDPNAQSASGRVAPRDYKPESKEPNEHTNPKPNDDTNPQPSENATPQSNNSSATQESGLRQRQQRQRDAEDEILGLKKT